jgi:hypothetical protein
MAVSDENKVDQKTIDLLNKVTTQINAQNQQIFHNQFAGYQNAIKSNVVQSNVLSTFSPKTAWDEAVDITLSPNIDMENPIYANEFEECGSVEIGQNGIIDPPIKNASIGLIDEVSENEDDLFAKLLDGEIIPFKGHPEKFSVEIFTWNDLQRSDLIGSEVKKAATCHIMINDRLARIIEGTDVQDLLMKADRAIDELKVQPFSICRDSHTIIGREIYYDNQPAIINNIDELNNFIHIIPDPNYLNTFTPPPYALENDEFDEWTTNFGRGMLIRDYDEKIWWWRNNKGTSIDPSTDEYYKQFPQPVVGPLQIQYPTMTPYYPGGIGIIQSSNTNPWTTNPPSTITTSPDIGTTNITRTTPMNMIDNIVYTYNGTNVNWGSVSNTEHVPITTKEQLVNDTQDYVDKMIEPINKSYYNKYRGKKAKKPRKAVAYKLGEKSPFPDKEYNADFVEDTIIEEEEPF